MREKTLSIFFFSFLFFLATRGVGNEGEGGIPFFFSSSILVVSWLHLNVVEVKNRDDLEDEHDVKGEYNKKPRTEQLLLEVQREAMHR